MKLCGINLTKAMKDLCNAPFQVLKKARTPESVLSATWICITNTVRITVLPKVIYKVNVITIKIPRQFFTELKKKKKLHMEAQEILGSQNNPK